MKQIGLMLIGIIASILLIPLIIVGGVGPGVKVNGGDSAGVINIEFDGKDKNTEPASNASNEPANETKNETAAESPKVKVFNVKTNGVQEISVEEYLLGVISAEMPAEFEMEALKAQSVTSRTYVVTRMKAYGGPGCKSHPEADICTDSKCCQAWMSREDRLSSWKASDAAAYWDKIVKAVESTRDMIMTYNSEPVMYPVFFSTSSGRTENSEDVFVSAYPYLKSVESPNEQVAPKYSTTITMTWAEFIKKFAECEYKIKLDSSKLPSQVKILTRSQGGSVKTIQVGSKTLKGTEVRTILGLNSANFTILFGKTDVVINVLGNGHGVGMSQWGANVMAQSGKKFDEILKHYYQGIDIGNINILFKKVQGT